MDLKLYDVEQAGCRSSTEISRTPTNLECQNQCRIQNELVTETTNYEDSRLNRSLASILGFLNLSQRQIDSPPPTIFFDRQRHAFHNVRGYRRIILCCQRNQNTSVDDIDRRAPPSYSAIIAHERAINDNLLGNNDHAAVLMGEQSSFAAYTPPPSYVQAQGICVPYSVEQLINDSANAGRIGSPRSTTAICPRCATLVLTVVETQQDIVTHVTAFVLCLIGCWPCCMLPYCIDTCKKSHHYCPYCRTYLGTYTPW